MSVNIDFTMKDGQSILIFVNSIQYTLKFENGKALLYLNGYMSDAIPQQITKTELQKLDKTLQPALPLHFPTKELNI